MHIPPDLFAVPLLLVFVGIEALVRPDRFRRADTLTNLSSGLLQLAFDVVGKGLFLAMYALAYQARVMELTSTVVGVVAAFFLIDLCFYVFHRTGHRVNLFWAVHSVHHQSEEMNFSVGLRVSMLKNLVAWPFYLPVALLGVPPVLFLVLEGINTLLQFPIHTRWVRSLGPLDYVLNTPAHHRVHHGCDPEYIDKNFGGVFIIWDRLLGTFEPEDQPVTFGLVSACTTWNPVRAQWLPFKRIIGLSRRSTTWGQALYAWIAPPEWLPGEPPKPIAAVRGRRKLISGRPDWGYRFGVVLLGGGIAASLLHLFWGGPIKYAGALLTVMVLAVLGVVLDRAGARRAEATDDAA